VIRAKTRRVFAWLATEAAWQIRRHGNVLLNLFHLNRELVPGRESLQRNGTFSPFAMKFVEAMR
jgi:hypothetical protein